MRLIIELIILVLCLGAAAYVWFKRPTWCISKQVKRDEEITGKKYDYNKIYRNTALMFLALAVFEVLLILVSSYLHIL